MGARPLRRAIQRYIEDPLADEVLRQGEIESGTTVLVELDSSPSADSEEHPLTMKLVKPKKRPARKKEPVGVGAGSDDAPPEPAGDNGAPPAAGDGDSSE
jgi:ATP-dependent Clp protease ATP-binding subunit ClpC